MIDLAKIRLVTSGELERLQLIERHAGKIFASIGMQAIADDEPLPTEELAHFQLEHRAWGFEALVPNGADLVAYVLAREVDGCAHIEQVSVLPEFSHRGIGKALIGTVEEWGREQGYSHCTLTTFVDVVWNGPYYLRLGFTYVAPGELTPGLQAIRTAEKEAGLDRWPRACMKKDLVATEVRY